MIGTTATTSIRNHDIVIIGVIEERDLWIDQSVLI